MSAAQGNSANQRFFDKLLYSAGYHPISAITFLMKQVKEVIDVLGRLVVVCARVPPAYTGGRRFPAQQFHPPLGVFDDSLQDDWGRRLLAQSLRFEGLTSTPPELLLRMQGRMGALVFTPTPTVTVPQATLETTSLSALLTAAAAFEAGTLERNDAFRRLIEGSSRAGGARPKRSCTKEGEWLAKSPSATGDAELDVVGLEGTCLVIAAAAGLRVPVSRCRQ
jgi:hypothetical protein